jgi:hypothetical protein
LIRLSGYGRRIIVEAASLALRNSAVLRGNREVFAQEHTVATNGVRLFDLPPFAFIS